MHCNPKYHLLYVLECFTFWIFEIALAAFLTASKAITFLFLQPQNEKQGLYFQGFCCCILLWFIMQRRKMFEEFCIFNFWNIFWRFFLFSDPCVSNILFISFQGDSVLSSWPVNQRQPTRLRYQQRTRSLFSTRFMRSWSWMRLGGGLLNSHSVLWPSSETFCFLSPLFTTGKQNFLMFVQTMHIENMTKNHQSFALWSQW